MCWAFIERHSISTLDITGGAPELNAHFRRLVTAARDMDVKVMDRCNLTIFEVPGQEDLGEFLRDRQVEIVASMPCYLQDNVDRQRGKGVFDGSIRGLRRLNALGYGQAAAASSSISSTIRKGRRCRRRRTNSRPTTNACSASVTGRFNRLYTLANMPIQRFGAILIAQGEFEHYLGLLQHAHLDANLDG